MSTPDDVPPQYGQPQYGQQQYGQQRYPPQANTNMLQQDNFWASAAHWGALVAGFVSGGFLPIIVPLVIMLTKGTTSSVVRRHAVESLNFQISMTIYLVVSIVLMLVLVGFITALVVAIMWLVCCILAAVKASNGEDYRYPLTLRLVS